MSCRRVVLLQSFEYFNVISIVDIILQTMENCFGDSLGRPFPLKLRGKLQLKENNKLYHHHVISIVLLSAITVDQSAHEKFLSYCKMVHWNLKY